MMTKERFSQTSFKMSYAEHRCCDCSGCSRTDCVHREAYRRFPEIDGGLGLCSNLKFVTVIGEEGVLVESNSKIKDYRTKEHAIAEFEDNPNYSSIVYQLKMNYVYCK